MNLAMRLAAQEHERWARWQKYLHSKCNKNSDGSLTIPSELVKRWEKQIVTDFYSLSEKERKSDLKEAQNTLTTLQVYFFQLSQKAYLEDK